MSRIRALLLAVSVLMPQLLLSTNSGQAQGIPQDIPRKELLILENPEGTIKNAGWFNIWAINAGSQSNGLQQAALDTLWYIDPESGLDGVWSNSLAADKPQYNADFTEMTAKLRNGIFWSDGVEFTADDVISTVMTQIKNPGMRFSAVLTSNVASVDAPIPTRWCSSSRSPTRASTPTSRCDGTRSGSCQSMCSRKRPGQVRFQQAGFARRLRAEQL
jgi:peptide/nickel transport system substrate-binding protein